MKGRKSMMEKRVNKESGNVLFLILIAVALFAALSYAVTSSTNSGGGNADEESSLVNSAAIAQYPASIKTAIVRMTAMKGVSNTGVGTSDTGLLFNKPDDFGSITPGQEYRAVFHPAGGNAAYYDATQGITAGASGAWIFTRAFEIANVGSSTAGDLAGNEIIAFLPNVTKGICDKINEQSSIAGTDIVHDAGVTITDNLLVEGATEADAGIIGGTATTAPDIAGKYNGCFRNGAAGPYVYYHVLLAQ